MKTLRFLTAVLWGFLVASCMSASAAPVTLGWEGTAPQYEVWRGIDKLVTVTTTEANLNLPTNKLSKLVVIAVYPPTTIMQIAIRLESEEFIVQPVPIFFSDNLQNWNSVPVVFCKFSPKLFLRAAFITQ